MAISEAINQRDLRLRSRQIMDAVESGEEFIVTRDGREIGELIPLRQHQQFVSRAEFAAMSVAAPIIGLSQFRRDLGVLDDGMSDPFAR